MGLPILNEIFGVVTDVVGKAVVDKDKKNEILYKIEVLKDQADARVHEELLQQIEVNKEEAKHQNVFVSGWRPAVGWTCVTGLAYEFVFAPFIGLFVDKVPTVDTNTLMTLILGMLGLGTMRTYEKAKGVTK
jgi:hypothetical protein